MIHFLKMNHVRVDIIDSQKRFPRFCILYFIIFARALCRTKYADVRAIKDFCSNFGSLWFCLIKNA